MSYAPAPGSVPYRAIAYLQRQPAGAEVKTSVLAEAIGAPPASMNTCMEPARTAGLVFARQRDAHRTSPMWWSLVDHSKDAPLRVPTIADLSGDDLRGLPPAVVGQLSRAGQAEHARQVAEQDSTPARASPAGDGSQKPDDGAASFPAARAGSDTPQEGANRAAGESQRSTEQSHGAAGSESPTGRGDNVAPALGAAPASIPPEPGPQQVLKAEPATADATDRGAPDTRSPGGGRTGVGQPAAAGPAGERVTLASLRGMATLPVGMASEDVVERSRADMPLIGLSATVSMTGEVAVVAECGTVILFDAQRGRQLIAFLAGRAVG